MAINRETTLRVIVIFHFVCVNMVLMADWLPKSYLFNQTAIFALGLWAIVHRDSVLGVKLLMIIEFISILMDAIAIGMYFHVRTDTHSIPYVKAYFVISAIFAIFLVIVKPIMLFLLYKVRQDRLDRSSYSDWENNSAYVPVDGH